MIGIVMFFVGMCMLLLGFPVAFTFGAVSVFFGIFAGVFEALGDGGTLVEGIQAGINLFAFMPHRIWSIMNNTILILLGITYALKEDSHARVDVLYSRFSPETKAIVNIIGSVVFIMPIALLILFGSLGFVQEAYQTKAIVNIIGSVVFIMPIALLIRYEC